MCITINGQQVGLNEGSAMKNGQNKSLLRLQNEQKAE